MAAAAPRNVYQRLSDAKKIVAKATFTKAKGEGLKYDYLPIEKIKPVVEDAMNEAGLVLIFGDLDTYEIRPAYEKVSPYGDKSWWLHYGGSQTFTWINIDDPSDRLEMTFSGEAKDNSDKCVSKLYTAIIKNFYKQVFNISTDRKDDPDNTEDEKRLEDAERRMRVAESMKATKDPFFRSKTKDDGKQKEKQTEEDIPPAEAPAVTEITLERPREVKEETINKACKDANLRLVVMKYAKQKEYGYNTETWTDAQIDTVYGAVVEAGRQ